MLSDDILVGVRDVLFQEQDSFTQVGDFSEVANGIFFQHNSYQLSRNFDSKLLFKLTSHFSWRDKLKNDMVDSNFSKTTVSAKIKVKLPNMTDWLIGVELHPEPRQS